MANVDATCESIGFGICGHKNSYSRGVRYGNWVEDTFDHKPTKVEIEESRAIPKSEAQERFVARDEPDTVEHSLETATKAMEMQGLSSNLLLNHRGDGRLHLPQPDPERYQSSYDSHFNEHSALDSYKAPRTKRLARTKEIAREKEIWSNQFETSNLSAMKAPYVAQAAASVGKPDGKRFVSDMSFSKSFHKYTY